MYSDFDDASGDSMKMNPVWLKYPTEFINLLVMNVH